MIFTPIRGLAKLAIEQKKTLVITNPDSYEEYDSKIDVSFKDGKPKPLICVPIMNTEDDRKVEGCIQLEFRMKHYLSSNPLLGGNFGEFKLDLVTKEILEIFMNQLRISIERLNVLA